MDVYIYSLEKTLFEGTTEVITLPTPEGEISILKNHIPLITPLASGEIKIKRGRDFDEEVHTVKIERGFAQINPGGVILLVESDTVVT